MSNNFSELNQELDQVVPSDLLAKVMSRLDQERRLRSVRRRLIFSVTAFLPLLLIIFPVWQNFWLDWQRAGLIDYLSLLTSDTKLVLTNWQNYSLGFLEFFPVVSTALILGVVLMMLVLIKFVLKYSQEFFVTSAWYLNKQHN
jgi:hypothetical protein